MNKKNIDIKQTITRVVSETVATAKGKKATGTVIAKVSRDLEIIQIKADSL